MNQKRRKTLHQFLDELDRLRNVSDKAIATEILKTAYANIDKCCDEEELALDSIPENLHWSLNYENLSDNVADLSDIKCDLECLIETCQNMAHYDYGKISKEITTIVNTAKNVIER